MSVPLLWNVNAQLHNLLNRKQSLEGMCHDSALRRHQLRQLELMAEKVDDELGTGPIQLQLVKSPKLL